MSETADDDLEIAFSKTSIQHLSDALLNTCQPDLEKSRDQLSELTDKQQVLTQVLHDENLKIAWTQNSVDLYKMFDTIGVYYNKLVNIKKEMKKLHDTNIKLKKRALRLQQHKEKMEYIFNQQKADELKKEQDLIGHKQ